MTRIIALYGPPASGKSTLVRRARERGTTAFDAEEFGVTHDERVRGVGTALRGLVSEFVLVGAADLTPEEFPPHTEFVLLLPPPDEHARRVLGRGDSRPHKALAHAQQVHSEHAAMRSIFSLVIDFDCSVESALELIERGGANG